MGRICSVVFKLLPDISVHFKWKIDQEKMLGGKRCPRRVRPNYVKQYMVETQARYKCLVCLNKISNTVLTFGNINHLLSFVINLYWPQSFWVSIVPLIAPSPEASCIPLSILQWSSRVTALKSSNAQSSGEGGIGLIKMWSYFK